MAFCEVKSRRGDGFGDPLELVTYEKTRRVRHAADAWLAVHPELAALRIRYDVLVERKGRLEHVPGAF